MERTFKGDAERIFSYHPTPACRPFARSRKRATAMKNGIRFIPLLNSLSGRRETCRHPETSRPPSSSGGLVGTAGGGSSQSGSPHFFQIASHVCIMLSTSRLARRSHRKGYESRSADTNTGLLFFMCSTTHHAPCGGGGGFHRKTPYRSIQSSELKWLITDQNDAQWS